MCAATGSLVGELPLPDVRAPLHVELGPQLPVLFLALACPAWIVLILVGFQAGIQVAIAARKSKGRQQ